MAIKRSPRRRPATGSWHQPTSDNPLRRSCSGNAAHASPARQAGGHNTYFVPIPIPQEKQPRSPSTATGARSQDTQLEGGWCDDDGNDQGRRQASSLSSPSWQLHRALGTVGIGQRPVAEDWAADGRQLAEAGAGLLSTKHNPTPSLSSDSTIRDSEAQHSTPDMIPQCTGSLCALRLGRPSLTVLPQRVNILHTRRYQQAFVQADLLSGEHLEADSRQSLIRAGLVASPPSDVVVCTYENSPRDSGLDKELESISKTAAVSSLARRLVSTNCHPPLDD